MSDNEPIRIPGSAITEVDGREAVGESVTLQMGPTEWDVLLTVGPAVAEYRAARAKAASEWG